MGRGGCVLVGVDGTAESQRALRWALEAAKARDLPVRIIRAYLVEASPWTGMAHYVPEPPPIDRYQAELDAAVQLVRDRLGYDGASGWLANDIPANAILTEAVEAELVVLGTRSKSKLSAAVLGSVATSVAAKAPCPVVIVRGEPRTGPVIVGLDGSAESEDALAVGFEEAARARTDLTAVHCWQVGDQPAQAATNARDGLKNWLEERVSPYRDKYSSVSVHTVVAEGRASTHLIDLSESASLVAVGSRGRGGVAGLLLGSVSQSLLHHANCPVVVVRRPVEDR